MPLLAEVLAARRRDSIEVQYTPNTDTDIYLSACNGHEIGGREIIDTSVRNSAVLAGSKYMGAEGQIKSWRQSKK